ncbi:MAG: TRAP transporter small permease subunit [Desulfobacterales bacterium]|nr:TRAP transporter small permease subunit [Desulfobacterales bacterium]
MKIQKFLNLVDSISKWTGTAVSWLMLVLVLELVYDTVARYVFNAPTIWSFDISYMLYSILFMIGGAYTLLVQEHIRVDMFYEKFSKKKKALVDIIGYLLFFFPAIGGMFVFGILFTHESWAIGEHCTKSYWSPPVYHFKTVIPIAAFLLLLQGIAEFIRSIIDLTEKDKEL